MQALRSEMEKKSEQLKHTNTVVKYQSSKNSGGSAELCGHVIRTEALRPWSILIDKSNLPVLPIPQPVTQAAWPRAHDPDVGCKSGLPAVAGSGGHPKTQIDSDRF